MIYVKVRYGKQVISNVPLSSMKDVAMTTTVVQQKITFYRSGRKMKEFTLPAYSRRNVIMSMLDKVKTFSEYAKSIDAIDELK